MLSNAFSFKHFITFSFFSLLFFTNCSFVRQGGNLVEAKIISATSQKYSGGQKGSPSGIKYKLLLIAPGNQDDFKTIGCWIDGQYTDAKAFRNKLGTNKLKYNLGDTLTVSANYIKFPQGYVNKDESNQMIKPENMSQKVVLLYIFKNQKKYTGFNEIVVLQEELRP